MKPDLNKIKRVTIDAEARKTLLKLYESISKDGHEKLSLNDVLKASLAKTLSSKEELKVSHEWTLGDILIRLKKDFKAELSTPIKSDISKKVIQIIRRRTEETEEISGSNPRKDLRKRVKKDTKSVSQAVSHPISQVSKEESVNP